jgi:hyperosmotically inducible periplasmic protein
MQLKSNRRIVIVTWVAGTIALATLVGCQSDGGSRTAGRRKDDNAVTKSVKNDLKHDPVYKFDGVSVETYDGIVQLSGFVDSPEQKTQAGQVASTTEGAHQIVNNIIVKPVAPMAPTGSPTGRLDATTRLQSSTEPVTVIVNQPAPTGSPKAIEQQPPTTQPKNQQP